MASPLYMTIAGVKQNKITDGASSEDSLGEAFEEKRQDEVMVISYEHVIESPRDRVTGCSSGTCAHGHVKITKVMDKSSPQLMQALTEGEPLTEVTIRWYRTVQGQPQHYFTTTLEDARVVKKHDYMHNRQDPNLAHFTHLEDVSFSYGKIIQTHLAAGSEASAVWREAAPAPAG
ncbi:Hcp family type VI secretion system effector [Pseudomonas sp. R1-18]|uniref:Hcp family type VI secretion system effector n=1 Tax=Pseudomonas sp. R1-18 TaxID=1632772 RepID=UPI003DA81357